MSLQFDCCVRADRTKFRTMLVMERFSGRRRRRIHNEPNFRPASVPDYLLDTEMNQYIELDSL